MAFDILPYFQALTVTDWIIIGALLLVWLFRFIYDLLFYGRLAFRKIPPAGLSSEPITVFMVERNEEENLRNNLPAWLQMGYPHYEILVVDDFSEDNTPGVLGLYRKEYPRLKITSLKQETRFSDKMARNLALKAASNEFVVMINAASLSPDDHWLPGISTVFSKGKHVVVGYNGIVPGQGFYHRLYRVESFFQQIQSMAYCLNGMPYVTNEENVAFFKGSYFDHGGLAGKIREEYLNLEMVINEVVRRGNVAVMPDGKLSIRKKVDVGRDEWKDLYHRYFRLKGYLKPGIRTMINLSGLLTMALPMVFAFLFISYPGLSLVWGGLLLLKLLFYLLIIKRLQARLNEPKIFVSSLIYALFAPYYKVFVQWRFINSRRKRRWGT
jgi:glycosyltransferase involved in cell wall biosynthesis